MKEKCPNCYVLNQKEICGHCHCVGCGKHYYPQSQMIIECEGEFKGFLDMEEMTPPVRRIN